MTGRPRTTHGWPTLYLRWPEKEHAELKAESDRLGISRWRLLLSAWRAYRRACGRRRAREE